jgi:hypothetical protein
MSRPDADDRPGVRTASLSSAGHSSSGLVPAHCPMREGWAWPIRRVTSRDGPAGGLVVGKPSPVCLARTRTRGTPPPPVADPSRGPTEESTRPGARSGASRARAHTRERKRCEGTPPPADEFVGAGLVGDGPATGKGEAAAAAMSRRRPWRPTPRSIPARALPRLCSVGRLEDAKPRTCVENVG